MPEKCCTGSVRPGYIMNGGGRQMIAMPFCQQGLSKFLSKFYVLRSGKYNHACLHVQAL